MPPTPNKKAPGAKLFKNFKATNNGVGYSSTTEGDIESEGPSDPAGKARRARQRALLSEIDRSTTPTRRVGPAKKSL